MAVEQLNEGVDYTVTINTSSDTDGETITAKLFAADGTETTVGTADGDVADTDIDIVLTLNDKAPGQYELEIWSDLSGVNQELLWPEEGEVQYIEIYDRQSV